MNASTLNQGPGQDPSCPPCPPRTAACSATADGAVFLRRQQAVLLRSLRDADGDTDGGADPVAPPDDSAHPQWLALIAAAGDQCGHAAADRVTRLFEYHGRVAGSLERQRRLPLPPAAARKLHRLLAARLAELTDDAVAALTPKG